MLGDFVYESSSAEDESRRILELLREEGLNALHGKARKELEAFTGQNDRQGATKAKEAHVSWNRTDELSQEIIELLASCLGRDDSEFEKNRAALDRMFSTTAALRRFRNQVDHRSPSTNGGRLHYYQDAESEVT
ncbi:MAG TPA: hypothetical protein VN108_06095, partial [Marmoricola sp.]|nr:hypothetical protein [Marmoricola sp.]